MTSTRARGAVNSARASAIDLRASKLGGDAAASATTKIALLGGDRVGADADVVVALAGPWALAKSHAKVYVTAWGRAGPQLDAVANVLTHPGTAAGTWPVLGAAPR